MKPEPDFNQIARTILEFALDSGPIIPSAWATTLTAIAEQLRLVWNARGTADAKSLETLHRTDRELAPYIDAIKGLDR